MRIKKGLIVALIAMLVFLLIPLTALSEEGTGDENATVQTVSGNYSTKDEVIYGKLDANGEVKTIYVVNTVHVTEPGTIVDYGDFVDIRNLTDLSDIEQTKGDEIYFEADEGEFYYQGELTNKLLPWDITIQYLLDGKEVRADDLAGQTGSLEIQISTAQNSMIDPLFFENYLMQISASFNPDIFKNIQAPKGTEANEGKNKLITFSIMPETEEELIITADVKNLEMDPINISAIPANIAIENPDIGDMKEDMQELSDAIREINSGVGEISDGISELNAGTTKLSDGSTDYLAGMNQLDESSSKLVDGSREIRDVLQQVSSAMQGGTNLPDMENIDELPQGLREIAGGLREFAAGLEALSDGYKDAYGALSEAIDGIPEYMIAPEQFEALVQSGADPVIVEQLAETYDAALTVKGTYAAVQEGFTSVRGGLGALPDGLSEMAKLLDTMAAGMEGAMNDLEQLDALADLQTGLSTLASEYGTFHNGLVSYTEGVHSLAINYEELDSGIKGMSDGTSALDDGASMLHEGTEELESATSDIPEDMQSEIDKLMEEYENKDFEPASFVSDKNEHVDVVQFVLQTERIELEEVEEVQVEEEEEKSIWDRLLDLFR